MRNIENDPV
jgi:hypothetical protein